MRQSGIDQVSTAVQYANDVPPGKLGATLMLANGKRIRLSDVADGALASESGVSISKTANGQVVYKVIQKGIVSNARNTMSTEKGETYFVVLPDGSKVWLNAASSISYNARLLDEDKRKIQLSGEAYFEVVNDSKHPFIVESNGQQVEVLGTHFNISAYNDDPSIRTTLVEGSVKVKTSSKDILLRPNQQALLEGSNLEVSDVNAKRATAWKNNNFVFANEKIETVMKLLERWYNVEVEYRGAMPQDRFRGSVSRFENISTVLGILEATGLVRFQIKDRRIYVSKS